MINIIKHFLSLNRLMENHLLLNTIYLIFLISIFTILISLFIIKKKEKIPFLIDSKLIEFFAFLGPSIIISILSIYTIKSSFYLNPIKILYSNLKPLILEIISMNWKWMFLFPVQKILTFNEICLPILIPIKFFLSSNNILNTLCIPKFGCQFYCMNNSNKYINFLILKHGFCHGFSSNYSGIGFNKLRINIFLLIKKNFFYWINNIKKSIFFNIKKYNLLIKEGNFLTKFFKIRNNKIFFLIIKRK
ncbi:hypothetical protein [Candidatus Carsonella ruddii]|uniref:Cytochrome O ubiquinol oxidase subunit II n=1 Tax=Carsonella ruddii TaxID=114186 RepID=A0A1U9RSG0_CARRU|nr:hypothetical protein [Candidatus Carsonella ruddii]AQU89603.1 Cytochrome O ubiquinol oxidase subunit II [Candidatus Carsonella ruddii]